MLTGAGISAASGIPTFRGAGGLWKRYRPEELATPEAFARDPATVWEWYGMRRDLVAAASPNPAHRALARLAERVGELRIITQNVDGLHQRAHAESGPSAHAIEVVELHGSLWRVRCTRCGATFENRDPGPAPGDLPRCRCGGLLRPGVVWFGEALEEEAVARAHAISVRAEWFLVVGTEGTVHPAASFASLARHGGAQIVEFNLAATALSPRAHAHWFAPAETSLPELLRALRARDGER